jgi:hypothetical protein
MHAVLRHFVDAARRRFLVSAIEMIEGTRALPDSKTIFNGFHYVSLGKHNRLVQAATQSELRGNR